MASTGYAHNKFKPEMIGRVVTVTVTTTIPLVSGERNQVEEFTGVLTDYINVEHDGDQVVTKTLFALNRFPSPVTCFDSKIKYSVFLYDKQESSF